jgi:hypothetical protein
MFNNEFPDFPQMGETPFPNFPQINEVQFPDFLQMNRNTLFIVPPSNGPEPEPIPCFREDTNILCYINEKEIYVKVQDILPGMRVKTLKCGYLLVDMIGKKKLNNPGHHSRIPNRIYKCTKENYPEIIDDLFITGHHSILVDEVSEKQREEIQDLYGYVYVTDDKYRLPCFLDMKSEVVEKEESVIIFHIALENNDYYSNYGIYANGLLVESCSKRYLKELSNMVLIV